MKHNIAEVAKLQPDYLGFIFYGKSPRYFDSEIPALPLGIKKVGVFVDATIAEILETFKKYNLDVIQLHGNETKEFVLTLNMYLRLKFWDGYEVWKVFSVDDSFDFSKTRDFVKKVDAFLFDTKGDHHGGNGKTFNWEILKNYKYKTPFILSGGIGIDEIDNLKEILKTNLPIYAIDVNSKFEIEPGMKDFSKLKKFINALNHE
ncbi:phosphoribosylanthranilate isomerase [Aequorivita sp. SDUM287046]|uniref:N-(5'-phosphoribosyl)anthranilate isomerase n=1 Tax=Aequorivita aurantiaca TaxID=3053356 RepID=A0ABT8DLK7_9FLAO|nr:phosphoribosylanthranilate isomerase [Aequorivita aurantiaca]MDN3724851.1 phosphoribosylanthranilate isomerase [Aequorivita aurantiaca]